MVREFNGFDISVPEDPAKDASISLNKTWEQQIDEYVKKYTINEQNKISLLAIIIWSQSSEAMQMKIKGQAEYYIEKDLKRGNSLWLLRPMKGISSKFGSEWYILCFQSYGYTYVLYITYVHNI